MKLKKLLALALSTVIGFSTLSFTATAEEESETKPTISVALCIDENLKFKLSVSNFEFQEGDKFRIEKPGSPNGANLIKLVDNGDGTYVGETLYESLFANDMDKEIKISIKRGGDEITDRYTISMKEYCEDIINGDYSDEAKTLAKNILNYGAKTTAYTNEESTIDVSEYEDVFKTASDFEKAIEGFDGTVKNEIPEGAEYKITSARLQLGSSLRFTFYTNTVTQNYDLFLTYSPNTVSEIQLIFSKGVSFLYLNYPLKAFCTFDNTYDAEIYFTSNQISKHEKGNVITYSPAKYMANTYRNTNSQAVRDLIVAIYSYADAAVAYSDSVQ